MRHRIPGGANNSGAQKSGDGRSAKTIPAAAAAAAVNENSEVEVEDVEDEVLDETDVDSRGHE